MDASIQITLPPVSALSSPALSFLNSEQDLSRARSFIDEFQSQCFNLDQTLIGLNSRLHSTLLSYASFSDGIHLLFDDATSKLTDLRSFTCPPPLSSSLSPSGLHVVSILWCCCLFFLLLYLWYFLLKIVECIDGQGRKEEILGEELPVLAKEVARVETVRAYAGQFCFYYWNKRVNVAVKYSKILLLYWFVLVVHTRLKYFVYVSQNGGFMFCCFLMIPWIGLIYFCCIIGGWVVFCGNSLHCTLSSLPNMRMDFVGYSQFPIHGSVNLKVNWSYYPQMVNPLHFCLCWC